MLVERDERLDRRLVGVVQADTNQASIKASIKAPMKPASGRN
jgi:hypothetical protein